MNIFPWALGRMRKFGVLDIAVFKIYLFLLGTIFGAYFSSFFRENIIVVIVLVVFSFLWLMIKMFKK